MSFQEFWLNTWGLGWGSLFRGQLHQWGHQARLIRWTGRCWCTAGRHLCPVSGTNCMPTEKGVASGDVRGGEMGQQQDGSDLQHENSNYMIFQYREMEMDTVSAKGTDMFPTRIQALDSASGLPCCLVIWARPVPCSAAESRSPPVFPGLTWKLAPPQASRGILINQCGWRRRACILSMSVSCTLQYKVEP